MSSASIAHATTWNGSAHRIAFGARAATVLAIQAAISADTWVSSGCPVVAELVEEHVQCSLAASGSGPDEAAGVVINHDDQVALPALLQEISSIPIRRRPARRSTVASTSLLTRVMIDPTVRHATRNS